MSGLANKNVQEKTGKHRYNIKLRFIWGIPKYEEDAEKLERSISIAVNIHIIPSNKSLILFANLTRSHLMNLGSFTMMGTAFI